MKELVSSDAAYQEALANLRLVVKEAISRGGHAISRGRSVRYPSHKGAGTMLVNQKAGSCALFPEERWELQTPSHQPMRDGGFMVMVIEPLDVEPTVARISSTAINADLELMGQSPDAVQALVISTQCLRAELN